jgi:hypothetical protein
LPPSIDDPVIIPGPSIGDDGDEGDFEEKETDEEELGI